MNLVLYRSDAPCAYLNCWWYLVAPLVEPDKEVGDDTILRMHRSPAYGIIRKHGEESDSDEVQARRVHCEDQAMMGCCLTFGQS